MPTTTIKVKYVNPPKPGKKRWSVKGEDDSYYGGLQTVISGLQVGSTYEVDYTEQPYNGQIYKTIEAARLQQAPAANPPGNSGGGTYRQTSVVDAERMFCTSILNAFIQAGKVDLRPDSVANTVRMLRGAWRETFGNTQAAPDMDDEIPF